MSLCRGLAYGYLGDMLSGEILSSRLKIEAIRLGMRQSHQVPLHYIKPPFRVAR